MQKAIEREVPGNAKVSDAHVGFRRFDSKRGEWACFQPRQNRLTYSMSSFGLFKLITWFKKTAIQPSLSLVSSIVLKGPEKEVWGGSSRGRDVK